MLIVFLYRSATTDYVGQIQEGLEGLGTDQCIFNRDGTITPIKDPTTLSPPSIKQESSEPVQSSSSIKQKSSKPIKYSSSIKQGSSEPVDCNSRRNERSPDSRRRRSKRKLKLKGMLASVPRAKDSRGSTSRSGVSHGRNDNRNSNNNCDSSYQRECK